MGYSCAQSPSFTSQTSCEVAGMLSSGEVAWCCVRKCQLFEDIRTVFYVSDAPAEGASKRSFK